MGGNTTTKTDSMNQKTDPWAGQQPYLSDAFSQASNLYNSQKGQYYTGDFYAQPTQAMTDAFNGNLGFSSGTGANAATTATNTGATAAGAGLSGAQTAIGQIQGMTGDQTQNNINAASQYANNPQMDSMVTAAMRDAGRQLNEQDLPTLDRNAAATGNLNSTRTGVAQGILERGLADKTADVSANLRGNAFQAGLGQAQQDYMNRLNAMSQGGAAAGSLLSQGLSGLSAGSDINNTNTNTNLTASTMLNGYNQSALDNQYAKYNAQTQTPWQNLQNYYGIIGGNNWGSSTTGSGTSTQQTNPSLLSSLGMGTALLGSLFKCDIRTKYDISYITTLPDGIKLYNFRYLDDPTQIHTGPMAQEVEEVYPDAIVEIDGIKHIDTTKYDWR